MKKSHYVPNVSFLRYCRPQGRSQDQRSVSESKEIVSSIGLETCRQITTTKYDVVFIHFLLLSSAQKYLLIAPLSLENKNCRYSHTNIFQ